MNKLLNSALAAAGLLMGTSVAAHTVHNAYEDYARVVSAKPIYEDVEVIIPRRECRTEQRVSHHHQPHHHTRRASYTGPLAGALLGGILGNQFGGGSGKTALTIGGALLGASIGDDVTGKHRYPPNYERPRRFENVEHCEIVDYVEIREELVGYRVKYRYNGKIYRTRMDSHPGDTVRVSVNERVRLID